MGLGVHRFSGVVDQNLICSICSSVFEDPVLTPCGHSFCLLCLETWLSNSGANTCPECRGHVGTNEARPILAIRNLVCNLNIHCDNVSRGCKVVVKLEKLAHHLENCGYVKVKCAGCGVEVNRSDLADHQINCAAIAAACDDDVIPGSARFEASQGRGTAEMSSLCYRVASLDLQLKRMKRDLQMAEVRNRTLERELKKTQEELEEKRNELLDQHYSEFDPEYGYGFSASTISQLACLISRYLLKKPAHVDRNEVFESIKRCHDRFGRCAHSAEDDVHMLVATAYASNWFTDSHKLQFHCWLQGIARHRQQRSGKSGR